jgi:hypothetical protein
MKFFPGIINKHLVTGNMLDVHDWFTAPEPLLVVMFEL